MNYFHRKAFLQLTERRGPMISATEHIDTAGSEEGSMGTAGGFESEEILRREAIPGS